MRTAVRDNPGSLAALTASLASHGLNILSVQIHDAADGAVDEFLLEAPVGAELVIHGGDLRHRWTVAVRRDR